MGPGAGPGQRVPTAVTAARPPGLIFAREFTRLAVPRRCTTACCGRGRVTEIHSGSCLGEDDIVRLKDQYGRQGTTR